MTNSSHHQVWLNIFCVVFASLLQMTWESCFFIGVTLSVSVYSLMSGCHKTQDGQDDNAKTYIYIYISFLPLCTTQKIWWWGGNLAKILFVAYFRYTECDCDCNADRCTFSDLFGWGVEVRDKFVSACLYTSLVGIYFELG